MKIKVNTYEIDVKKFANFSFFLEKGHITREGFIELISDIIEGYARWKVSVDEPAYEAWLIHRSIEADHGEIDFPESSGDLLNLNEEDPESDLVYRA